MIKALTSQPTVIGNDVDHFYVDGGSLEEPQDEHEETTEQDNVGGAPILVHLEPLPMKTPHLVNS